MRTPASSLAIVLLLAAVSGAAAQDKGTLNPQPLPPLAHPDDPKTPAKQLFGRKTEPTAGPMLVLAGGDVGRQQRDAFSGLPRLEPWCDAAREVGDDVVGDCLVKN